MGASLSDPSARARARLVVRLMVMIAVGAAAVAGVLSYKGREAAALEHRTLSAMKGHLEAMPGYSARGADIEAALPSVHARAWAEGFTREMFTGGTIDVSKYQRGVLAALMERARAGNDKVLESDLKILELELGLSHE